MEDFIELASRQPWWLGLVLAVVRYLVLRPITTAHLPTPNVSASVSAVPTGMLQAVMLAVQTSGSALHTAGGRPDNTTASPAPSTRLETPAASPSYNKPADPSACPRCSVEMTLRQARRGTNAGSWS